MNKITFEDATLVNQAKVSIGGTDYEITPATYSGGTDLNANTFNTMQSNIENAIPEVQTTKTTSDSDTYACNYINDKLELSNTLNVSQNDISISGGTISSGSITLKYNNDENLITFNSVLVFNKTSDRAILSFDTPLRPSSNKTLPNAVFCRQDNGSAWFPIFTDITLNTNGKMQFEVYDSLYGTSVIQMIPFLLIVD